MAVTDHIILSSSPILHQTPSPLPMSKNAPSSSPGLPSPSQLFMSKTVRLSNGSAVVPVPSKAHVGFTCASSLLQPTKSSTQEVRKSVNARFVLEAKKRLDELQQEPSEPAGKDQSKNTHADQLRVRQSTGSAKPRVSRKLQAVRAEDAQHGEGGLPKVKRSYKQSTKDEQTKIQDSKIVKPGVTKRHGGKVADQAVEGSGFRRQRKADTEKDAPAAWKEDSLGLTEALKRRKDWTPRKRPSEETETSGTNGTLSDPNSNVDSRDGAFGKLTFSFSYAESSHPAVKAFKGASGGSGTKRRKLDLVSRVVPAPANAASVKRAKSPKKKPQTITDKATAPFAPENLVLGSIRNYFPTPPRDVHSSFVSVAQEQSEEKGKESVPTRKATKRTKVKSQVAKKAKQPAILLSPESTMKVMNEQDLLFGTSSQLVREESPTHLREIQRAIKESEIGQKSPSVSCGNDSQISLQSDVSKLSSSKLPTATRRLWSAAARDEAGSLLNVDVMDLVETPQPSRSLPLQMGKLRDTEASDAFVEFPVPKFDGGKIPVEDKANNILPEDGNRMPRSVAEAALRERPRSKSPTKKWGRRKDPKVSTSELWLPDMPHYSGFADADLKKEVVAFGFKPMRRREEMISLLQRCWESKNRIALQSLPPNLPMTTVPAKDLAKEVSKANSPTKWSSPTMKKGRSAKGKGAATGNGPMIESVMPPKKPRGRPKKSTITQESASNLQTVAPAEANSNTHPIPPAPLPHGRTTANASGPAALTTSLPGTAATHDTQALFATITKAIKSYPPTHDASRLTWYEKMLIYDPIVLEDLADWLNREGLVLVGYEDSITPGLAKQWCESQSICCVWRQSLKGGTRVRH